jgi:putative heme-binding domain-containing protein
MTRFAVIAVFVGCIATGCADSDGRGKRLFDSHCAICHGIGGTGGTGPDLRQQPFVHARTDTELIRVILHGMGGTDMPASWALDRSDARQVAAYVRTLGRASREPVPGNAERGQAIYESADCSQCHIIAGAGRGLGPELTTIGSLRGPDHLRRAVAQPGDDIAREYVLVQIQTADGSRIEGIRLNEDTFTLQLRDFEGTLHSFRKDELKSHRVLQGRSLMRDYAAEFTPAELDDLVAYLTTLTRPE